MLKLALLTWILLGFLAMLPYITAIIGMWLGLLPLP